MRQFVAFATFGLLLSSALLVAAEQPAGKNYHDQDLQGKNFERAALNGADFSDAALKGVSFSGASLKNASFKGANVAGAEFGGADLTGADMRGTSGICDYRSTNLTDTNFEGVTFSIYWLCKCRGANFKKSVISGTVGDVDCGKANFSGASLRGAALSGANNSLKGAIYDDDTSFPDGFDPKAAGMLKEKADEVVVAGVPKDKDYHDQDLKGKSFASAALNGADFSDATLKGVSFNTASLKKASFKGANIEGANFGGADLTGADMRGTVGAAAYAITNLTDTNFEGVKFSPGLWCKCRGANFKKSIISGVIGENDFSKANFCGASLRGVTFTGTNNEFKGAIYDDDTSFPDTFDPKAAGMVKADAPEKK